MTSMRKRRLSHRGAAFVSSHDSCDVDLTPRSAILSTWPRTASPVRLRLNGAERKYIATLTGFRQMMIPRFHPYSRSSEINRSTVWTAAH